MTEKRCTDCKYTRGIGFDFWCGEGHTEYEVFGGTTDCPYYEYYDWSKGTPSRLENKRFQYNVNKNIIEENGKFVAYVNSVDGVRIAKKLNELAEENKLLKKDRFICLDCEHSGYGEIGCLCEYNDHWQDYITECEDFKGLRE